MEGLLSIERRGGVELVTLQRPHKRNALSIELRVELADAFGRFGDDGGIGAVVLTGAGSAFCAGMDTSQFGGDMENRRRLVETSTAAFGAVASCPLPVIAAVNGPALAGGFALAMLCDIRVAAASARFGFPELPRGIPPSYAALRAGLAPALAADLALTGRELDAAEALRLGIVSDVVDEGSVAARALELAAGVAAPGNATRETKRRILLDREQRFGPLFAEEERMFRDALLGGGGGPAA